MTTPTRRQLLIGGGALALIPLAPAFAAEDFHIDWQGGPQPPDMARSFAAQIALVKSLKIKPDIARFFAEQVITVDLTDDTKTRAGPRGVFFERKPSPPENPVLLHELLHRYHLLRLPQGFRNPEVIAFYDAAKASGQYRSDAYMLSNVVEFFAMMTSVVLWGEAARLPFTRANVAEKAPAMHAWIIKEFDLRI